MISTCPYHAQSAEVARKALLVRLQLTPRPVGGAAGQLRGGQSRVAG